MNVIPAKAGIQLKAKPPEPFVLSLSKHERI
jgi:hypothetical protein